MKTGFVCQFLITIACFVGSPGWADETKTYPFNASPAAELQRVRVLKDDVGGDSFEPGEAESTLLAWFEKGNLSAQQWAEAFLIASGETDSVRRQAHLQQLDQFADKLAQEAKGKSIRDQGERILKTLHEGAMSSGYDLSQSSLAAVFDTGKFNCVSSTVLYTLQAERLGLKLQAMEFPGTPWQPGHVMTILLDGEQQYDVETTSAHGFNARAHKAGFSSPLNDLKAGQKIDDLGLLLSVMNNRSADAAKAGRHLDALQLRLLMLGLSPQNSELQSQAEGAYYNLVLVLCKAGRKEQAVRVGRLGLEFAPESNGLKNNVKLAHAELAAQLIDAGKDQELTDLFTEAQRRWPDQGYDLDLVHAFTVAAQQAERDGRWQSAAEVLQRGLNLQPESKDLHNAVAYLTQESLRKIDAQDGAAAALAWLENLHATFPKSTDIKEVAETHANRIYRAKLSARNYDEARRAVNDRRAMFPADQAAYALGIICDSQGRALIGEKRWEQAAQVYADGLAVHPNHDVLVNNAPLVFDNWARVSMGKKDWGEAIRIYQLGLEQFPDNGLLKHNREYCESHLANK